jgi:aspartate/methionine/tyrosine aminotransferase
VRDWSIDASVERREQQRRYEVKPFSKMSGQVPVSGIRKLVDLASTMTGVIHLEVGEPDFPTPESIVEASFRATRGGATKYTGTVGTAEIRKATAARVNRLYGSSVSPEQIVVVPGATTALALALLALVDPGEEILVPDPGWPSYASMIVLTGGRFVPYRLSRESGYLPDMTDLRARVTPQTKVLMINNPGNPGGGVFPRAMVREIVEFATERDLFVLSDEVYEAFTFDGEHVPAAAFDRDGRVVTVSGWSKTYAMTGWRLGYAVASAPLAARMTPLAAALFSCPSAISQSAGVAALALPEAEITAMSDSYKRRRDLVVSMLQPAGLLGSVPRGAFYALVDLSRKGSDTYAIAHALLEQERVATVPGEAFGAEAQGMVRISFATAEDDLVEGLRRIARFAGAATDDRGADAARVARPVG